MHRSEAWRELSLCRALPLRLPAIHPLLDAGPYTFVAADTLVLNVREGGTVLAAGVNGDGHRKILGRTLSWTGGLLPEPGIWVIGM